MRWTRRDQQTLGCRTDFGGIGSKQMHRQTIHEAYGHLQGEMDVRESQTEADRRSVRTALQSDLARYLGPEGRAACSVHEESSHDHCDFRWGI